MSYQYSQEAKERISKLGQSEIVNFINEISPTLRRKAFGCLPKVPGFRAGHPTEIKEKQKRLIGYMFQSHPSSEERKAWKSFSLFWQFWAEEKIDKSFSMIDNLGLKENSGSIFIRELAKNFPKVARENIERLFIFSGFADDPDVINAFNLFPPAVVLARDIVIDTLPIRLDELEARISLIADNVEKKNNHIKELELKIDAFSEQFDNYFNNEKSSLKIINELQSLINSETKQSDIANKAIDELYHFNEKNKQLILSLLEKLDFNALAMNDISEHEKLIKSMANDISEFKNALTILCDNKIKNNELDYVNELKKLTERIDTLEINTSQASEVSVTNRFTKFHEIAHYENYEYLSSSEDISNRISLNLQAVGLTKNSAEKLARLTLATFVSGQIIQFSGSLADIIADAIAIAIGAPRYHIWRVPVGIISDMDAFDFIETIAESSRCLLLKGANLSAFEIYGAAIRDIVVQRQIHPTNYDHLALIATWKQGPATFPDGGMLAELGPVIDTDTLKMRGLSATLPQLKPGCLAKDKWTNIDGLHLDSVDDYVDELRALLDEAGFDGGTLWKRMIHIFYTSLIRIPNGNYIYDLYSVLSFYTLTWAKIKGGPVQKIEDIANRELKNYSAKISS
ncbi:TPA: Druantia anti-phage system protein DruC [Escherichia coli]